MKAEDAYFKRWGYKPDDGCDAETWLDGYNAALSYTKNKIQKAKNCLICAGIADPLEVCVETLSILDDAQEYNMQHGILENWTVQHSDNIPQYVIWGDVYSDTKGRFYEGQHIHTSGINKSQFPIDDLTEGLLVITDKSTYKLGCKAPPVQPLTEEELAKIDEVIDCFIF